MAGAPCRLLLLLGSGGGRRAAIAGPSCSSSSSSPLLPRWLALSHRLSHRLSHARAASAASTQEAEDADETTTTPRLNPRRAARLALESPSAALLPVVAVLGRPNVGKSALFNRLCGSREALVADTPAPGGHTTRDWREGLGRLGDLRFRVVDTSGLEPSLAAAAAGGGGRQATATPTPPPLQARAAQLTSRVVARSHVALVVLDATAGVTQDDVDLGLWLKTERALWRPRRRDGDDDDANANANAPALVAGPSGPAVLLVLNKAEARAARKRMPETLADVHANLGLLLPSTAAAREEAGADGAPAAASPASAEDDDDSRIVALSARSGEGLADLYVALRPHLEAAAASLRRRAQEEQASSSSLLLPQSPLLWPPPRPPPPLPGDAAAASDDNNNPPSSSSPPDPSLLPDWPRPDDGPMRVAIMGLPNAGKSTLLNALLGRERALTGPEPGLTRDAPHAWLEWRGGLRVELTDTAGWVPGSDLVDLAASDVKKPAGATPKEKKEAAAEARALAAAALERGRRAMDAAHVVVLLLDAHRLDRDGRLITKAELGLAAEAVKAGKALVVAVNKADLLVGREEEEGTRKRTTKRGGGGGGGKASSSPLPSWPEANKMAAELASALDARFADAGKPAVVALSALEAAAAAGVAGVGASSSSPASSSPRAGAAAVLDACAVAYARWTRRSGTSAVQRALDRCAARLAGTPAGAAVARVKWAAQLKARPPTFALSLRGAKPLPQGGDRFLASALREGLGLDGVPVRVSVQYNARADRGGGGGGGRAGRQRGGGGARRRR
jgi:predicted GTPase